jgi:hypothetical protein
MKSLRGAYKRFSWLSGLTLSLSVVAVIASLCIRFTDSDSKLEWDLYGVLIAILSTLVVVLVGWQIFQTVSIKSEVKDDVENIRRTNEKTIKELREDIKCRIDFASAELFGNMGHTSHIVKAYGEALDSYIKAIERLLRSKQNRPDYLKSLLLRAYRSIMDAEKNKKKNPIKLANEGVRAHYISVLKEVEYLSGYISVLIEKIKALEIDPKAEQY